ncbi:GNAT family N-acetyltransferase [Sphingomonas sp. DG1-23]|uniref:GNAT family N-acetyltransferase n=1 Tax=Sphingomonas sp. DG1-23 TaxID=3068316 RepID=UPI00273D9FC5|nr:GNAT family N-acetyltransferase [Sphingomonas sp. DG1-23]MDP5278940.1 GNAT family N-acetyltransferase [Sphingomonas sp. DG1-23]
MIHHSELATARLRVRPFAMDDRDALVALFADPRVARHVDDGQPLAAADAQLWIVRSRANLARHGYGTGAVVERASGTLIGWAGFARPEGGEQEIIYGLAADRWGRGYGRELLDALLRFAEARGIDPVKATVDPANATSIHLLRSSSFERARGNPGEDANTHVYYRARREGA